MEPIHLYLSRYQEHINYLRQTGQETPSFRELRENEIPRLLQVVDSYVQMATADGEEGQKAYKLLASVQLTDGTGWNISGEFVPSENDWFPDEQPLTHQTSYCGFCQGTLGFFKNEDMTQFDCMLPLPEKKWLFEKMLEQHGASIYPNQS